MFDHVKFGVRDFAASKAFYLKALQPIGVTVVTDWPPAGAELSQPNGGSSLCLYQTDERPAHLHIAFLAETREQLEFAKFTIACNNTLQPFSKSSGVALSASLWLSPPAQGTKIIEVGATRQTWQAS